MSLCGQKPPNLNHHPTKFLGFRHCVSGDIMVLVCRVILEDHMIKVLKYAIAVFSKAHGMSYSHIRNFTIKVALMKTFACVSSDNSLILATPPCKQLIKYEKKFFCRSVQKRWQEAKRERERTLFALHANVKISFRNKQLLPYPYYVKVPRELISWTSRKNKMPNYTIYFRYQLWWR